MASVRRPAGPARPGGAFQARLGGMLPVFRPRGLRAGFTRWRNRLIGPLWSVIEYIWFPLLMFATTPVFFRILGPERFGQWALLSATISLGTVLSTGTGAATIRQVAHRLAADDAAGVRLVVRAALLIALLGGAAAAAVVALVFGVGGPALLGRMGGGDALLATAATATAIIAIEQIENVFSSALRGGERFRVLARIELVVRTTQVLGAVAAVWAFGTLEALFAALIVTALARLLVKVLVVTRWLGSSVSRPSRALWREVIGDARWGWLQGAGGMIFGLADRFIVGSALGAVALAHYSVASQVAQPLHAFAAAATSVVLPKISAAMARGDTSRLRSLIGGGFLLLFGVTTAIALVVYVFRLPLLTAWLGAEAGAAAAPALGWLIWAFWVLALAVLPHFVLLGMGRMRFVALANVAAGLVCVGAMLWAAPLYGIAGVAAARIVYGVVLLATFIPLTSLWKPHVPS